MPVSLAEVLAGKDLDAVVLWRHEEIFCFTGYAPGAGDAVAAIVRPAQKPLLLVPAGTAPKADEWDLLEYGVYGFAQREYPATALAGLLSAQLAGLARIGASSALAPSAPWLALPSQLVDIGADMEPLMASKPAAFIPAFRKASEQNRLAYEAIRAGLRPGMDEFALRALVEASYHKSTGRLLPSGGDYLSGPRTNEISGPSTCRVIGKGEAVIVDIQTTLDGAGVDDCRTFFTGPPSDEMARAYTAVQGALAAAAAKLAPGTKACEVYATASAFLQSQGFASLPHHAGHGVGYAWYEPPFFIPSQQQALEAGMLVTLEPGVYLGSFGVRLENNYLITETGCELVTQTPLDMAWATLAF